MPLSLNTLRRHPRRPMARGARCAAVPTALAAGLLLSGAALAQTETVRVSAHPLRDAAQPSTVLQADALARRGGSTVGELLDGLAGVAASAFGPQASRPVLRGLDGDRVRLLQGGSAVHDASALSPDHAVPIEPLLLQRVELLRGPAALLHGGSALGGVVHLVDGRIPDAPAAGFSGAAELRAGGAANERAGVLRLDGGGAGLAWHADAYGRHAGELRVPAFDRPLEDAGSERRTRVANSAGRAEGGAVGATLFAAQGQLGFSADTHAQRYGIVAEDDVTIRLRRERVASAGEWRPTGGALQALRLQAVASDYRHDELEGNGAVGTHFAKRASELRLDAVQRERPLAGGTLAGAWGAQAERERFSATGEEAFVPSTTTRQAALYGLQRWSWGAAGAAGAGQIEAGLRVERARVASAGDAADAEEPRFGSPQERRFTPRSAALALRLHPAGGWTASLQAATHQRPPSASELFANGAHLATARFERGDPTLATERGRQLEAGLAWRGGPWRLQVQAWALRFANLVSLRATGEPPVVDEHGHELPVHAFEAVRARLAGHELELGWRGRAGAWTLDAALQLDAVRGDDLTHQEPLPRLPPQRAALSLQAERGAWQLGAVLRRAQAQTRIPAGDRPIPGWSRLDLQAGWRQRLGAGAAAGEALWFARLTNATDRLAYNASTVATVRARAPLPGRGLTLGLRLGF